jgi:hypothetical protein
LRGCSVEDPKVSFKLIGSIVVAGIFSFGLVQACLAGPSQAAPNLTFVLADYGLTNPSFNAFRAQLLDAVKRHDKRFVEEILATNVETGLGAGTGKGEFNKQWHNLAPTSLFWGRMSRVLNHGAEYVQDDGRVEAPATSFDDAKLGDSIQAIVWNKDAVLKDAPNDSAPAIDHLYNVQLTVLAPDQPAPIHDRWVKVQTQNGKTGFMKSDDLFSAYDEFAQFKKMNGKWRLVWFGMAGL